jgi:hypothetical protein
LVTLYLLEIEETVVGCEGLVRMAWALKGLKASLLVEMMGVDVC